MAYLFLNFSIHLEKNNRRGEFFSDSLTEQYNKLLLRIPLERQIPSFRVFIEKCFPTGMDKKYYISCPNFLREKNMTTNEKGYSSSYLNNVVIRPELTPSMLRCLPDHQNIILVGDICESEKLKSFHIKGIQLIDSSMSSPHDIVVKVAACNQFDQRIWSINRVEYGESFLTPDEIKEIIAKCYTVEDVASVRKTYDSWRQYIDFRKYYLNEQSKRNFALTDSLFIQAFAVNKRTYKQDSMLYDDYILDGHIKDFTSAEMILLSKQVGEAEPISLIRVDIDRNKKKFIEESENRGGRLINKEERLLRSLANDNVFLCIDNPSGMEYKSRQKNGSYELGERFRTIKFEIQPDLTLLENECDSEILKESNKIKKKYEAIREKELNDEIAGYSKSLEDENTQLILSLKKDLADSLMVDVEENIDQTVINEINKQKNKIKSSLKREKEEDGESFNERLFKEYSKIDIKSLYVERNEGTIKKAVSSYKVSLSSKVASKRILLSEQLEHKYAAPLREELLKSKEELSLKYEIKKNELIEEETIIRFSIYYKIPDNTQEVYKKNIDLINSAKFLVYNNVAEKAIIERQERALENFYNGNVKNPYLSTYLFASTELQPITTDDSDWTWYLDTLNDKQKEAVRKAVASNGIFLLQGPPGTGKTQVIAETIAHLVKQGKKVLVSSETHKAIDNVFERLPKIAEIVPIRLIPSTSKKDSEYSPENLVDNFYANVSTNMVKAIKRFERFNQNKVDFDENFKSLKLLNAKIEKTKLTFEKSNQEKKKYEEQTKVISEKINDLNDSYESLKIEIDSLRRTKRHIENSILRIDEDIDKELMAKYIKLLGSSFDSKIYQTADLPVFAKTLGSVSLEQVKDEILLVNPEAQETINEAKKKEIKASMDSLRDEIGDVLPEKQKEFEKLQNELKKIISLPSEKKSQIGDLKINSIYLLKTILEEYKTLANLFEDNRETLLNAQATIFSEIDSLIDKNTAKENEINEKIHQLKIQIKDINSRIDAINDSDDVREIQEARFTMNQEIDKFFKDFSIGRSYSSYEEALTIIQEEWDSLTKNYDEREKESKEKIPMYKKISSYLQSEDVITEDRKYYTKDLFSNANVFGLTCTSRDNFSKDKIKELADYNIDGIDIKTVGIDVVIIDEVSKSSFLDLLIPILYGKTIILVGDHRQLPPMYDLAKMREDEFENLDEEQITKEKNMKFKELYEECFFKKLFETIPNDYKTMLVQQYRCHGDIMAVFNHFYQNELKLGFEGQNNKKRHNIDITSNGIRILESDRHVYFVNCKKNESRDIDSTSIYNSGEAEVVSTLIKKINDYFRNHMNLERLSIGVICTYGDQARKIKQAMKNEHVKTDAFDLSQEKFIVSTVDDFQGDERDIIILSTVRNPANPAKSDPGFILAYQRINVALSRARKLLIIVGNRDYLENKGVIDLPDVNGQKSKDQRNFRVYEKILDTIAQKGKILEDDYVLDEKGGNINE